jgi:hypothetical protein
VRVLPSPPPTLKPFQVIGAAHLASHPRAALWDIMGLGKTPQAIAALQRLPVPARRVLIVAPLATALGWQREVARWWPDAPTFCRPSRRQALPADGLTFLPWTDLATRLPDLRRIIAERGAYDAAVFDEIHYAKSGQGSAVGKAFLALQSLLPRIFLLTGTPMPNGLPIELLPQLMALGLVGDGPKALMTRRAFELRHCRQSNPFVPSGFDLKGRHKLPELARQLRASGLVLRRRRSDVPGELPAIRRVVVELGGIAESATVTPDMRDALTAGVLPPLEEMSAYRRDLGTAKTPKAAAWIASQLHSVDALVVFAHHKATAHAIAAALPAGAAILATGDDDAAARQAKADAFAAGAGTAHPRVFLATIDACGTGLNGLHRRTTCCTFVEWPWAPGQLDQAEGRVCRMGGAGGADAQAVSYYLVAADCLDAHMAALIVRKREASQATLDGDAEQPAVLGAPQKYLAQP